MQAIVHDRFGPPDRVLRVDETERPSPAEGEVLVEVRAAGVNRGDWLIAMGLPYIARPSYGLRSPKQRIAGLEAAGVVTAAGAGVDEFAPGDEVFGWCTGAFARYVAVPVSHLAAKPARVGFEQAAATPVAGFTALQAVRDEGKIESGQRVMVLGASGGVGSFAVQIAKAHDAEVTGVCSTRNVGLVRSLGADHVVDYTREQIAQDGRFDVIVDTGGNRTLAELRRALTPGGTLVIVGSTGGRWTMGFGRTIRAMALSPFVKPRLRGLLSKPNRDDLDTLRDLMEAGKMTPAIGATYDLADAPRAVASLGGSHPGGKTVLTI